MLLNYLCADFFSNSVDKGVASQLVFEISNLTRFRLESEVGYTIHKLWNRK